MRFLALLRSFLVALIYPLVVCFFALQIVLLGFFPSWRRVQDQVVAAWARFSLLLFGVQVEGQGLEKLPKGGYIALFNHTSNFDILAVQALIPNIRFGAKIELFKIPIFGHAMRAARALPIARSQRNKVMRVYDKAKARLFAGECFILAPEGTRQPEDKLGPFKAGPFIFAVEAQVPIIPIAIKGASAIQPKKAWLPNSHQWRSKIQLIVGEPIPTKGLEPEAKEALKQQLREAFHRMGLQ